jgi:biopolymer transport protein ExbD
MAKRAVPAAGPAVNITSLSDIMLSLLIFFMLVSRTGVETGADPDLALPVASLGLTDEELEEEILAAAGRLVVNVQSSASPGNPESYGTLVSNGEIWSMPVRDPSTDSPNLQRHISTLKGEQEDFVVRVHAAPGTPYQDMEAVLRAISGAGVSGVEYAFDQQ